MISNISYSPGAFGNPDELIYDAMAALEDVNFTCMIGTGLSGALVVPLLARALDKDFAIIRKPGDGSHACADFEGYISYRWIFVDDFIATGATLQRVIETMKGLTRWANVRAQVASQPRYEFVGAYSYDTRPGGEGHDSSPFRTAHNLDAAYGLGLG